MEIQKATKSALLEFGVSPKLLGYTYLKEAIHMVYEDRTLLCALTTRLYPMVGDRLNVNPRNIERNIRYAVQNAVNSMEYGKTDRRFFRYPIKDNGRWITTGAFLAIIVEYLDDTVEGGEISGNED